MIKNKQKIKFITGGYIGLLVCLFLMPYYALAATTIGTNISTNGNLTVDGSLLFSSGAGVGKLLQSDALGNATWQTVGSVGEANTASNVGTGAGIYKQKTGVDLELKSLTSPQSTLTVTANASDISLEVNTTTITISSSIIIDKGAVNGLATLDAAGKLTAGQIPAIAITNTYVAADIAARDALTVETGDVAIVTDAGGGESRSYIYDGSVWKELLTPVSLYLSKANNLSDLGNVPTARTNLGLGTGDSPTFSALNISTFANFTPGAAPAYAEGRLYYDSTSKSLSYYNDHSAVPINIGQKNVLRVENNSGGPITYGQVVYISGSGTGGIPAISLAKADNFATSKVLGFAAEDIANGSQGYVIAYGLLTQIPFSLAGFSSGDLLYLSPTVAGGITVTLPSQPNFAVPIGYIGANLAAPNGTLMAFVVPNPAPSLVSGGVAFGGSSNYLSSDSVNFFWDNTNNRLGIGTNSPGYGLDVWGGLKVATSSLLVLGSKANPDPTDAVNGAMYYNASTNKFRCYENSAWKDCDTAVAGVTLQNVYDSGATITTAGSVDIAFTLTAGDFTVGGAGAVKLSPASGVSLNPFGVAVGNTSELRFSELAANGTDYIGFKAPDGIAANIMWTLPAADGAAGERLITDGSGVLSWAAAGGGVVLSSITAAAAANTINNDDKAQVWNWSLTTADKAGFTFGENAAATVTSTILMVSALTGSKATPLYVKNLGDKTSFRVDDSAGDVSPVLIDENGNLAIGSDFFDPTNPEKLKVDSGNSTSFNIITAGGDINSYLQMNIQNRNAGTDASTDIVATADNGDEDSYYIDLGINSSGYTNAAYSIGGPNDAYILSQGGVAGTGNLSIGTGVAGTVIKFHLGGSTAADEKMRINAAGNVGIGTSTVNARLDIQSSDEHTLRVEPYGAAAGNTGNLELMELYANGSNYVGFKAPDSIAASLAWTLPSSDGGAGQFLATNGSGVLSWATGGSGSGWATSSEEYFWNNTSTWSGFESQFDSFVIASTTIAKGACSAGEVLKWNGSAWICAADNTAGGWAWATSSEQYFWNTTTTWAGFESQFNSFVIASTTIAKGGCASGEVLKWNGSAWACAADNTAGGWAWATSSEQYFWNTTTTWAGFESQFNSFVIASTTIAKGGCASGEVLKWNGSAWACGVDNFGAAGGWSTSSEQYFWNTTSTWAGFENQFNSFVIASTTIAKGGCASGEVLKWNGSAWACAADNTTGGWAWATSSEEYFWNTTSTWSGFESQFDSFVIASTTIAKGGCASGEVLKWNGSAWACAADNTAGGWAWATSSEEYFWNNTSTWSGFENQFNSFVIASTTIAKGGCASGEVLKWNGSAWACAADNTTGGWAWATSSEEYFWNNTSTWSGFENQFNSFVIASTTIAKGGCASGEVLKWNGSAWACAADNTAGGWAWATSSEEYFWNTTSTWSGFESQFNSFVIASTTIAKGGCASGEVLKWNGSAWICAADNTAGGWAWATSSEEYFWNNTSTWSGFENQFNSFVIASTTIAKGGCASGEVLKWNGSAWACAADNTAAGWAWATSSEEYFWNTTSTWSGFENQFNSFVIASTTIAKGGCASNEILKWNGSAWICAADNTAAATWAWATSSEEYFWNTTTTWAGFESQFNSFVIASTTIAKGGCASGEVLKWNGTAWICSADNTGGSGWSTSSEQYFWNNTTTWAYFGDNWNSYFNATTTWGGFQSEFDKYVIASTTIAKGGCAAAQILKWNGSAWVCSADDSGAAAGSPGAWENIFTNTLTPTSTNAGFFVTGSSTVASNFRVDGAVAITGNATTSGHLAALGGNSDQWNLAYASIWGTTQEQNFWNTTTTWAGFQGEFNAYFNASTTIREKISRSIGTAKGDLISFTASGVPVRLPVGGTNDWTLQVDSAQATGLKWAAPSIAANSVDFAQLADAMTVDAPTAVNLAGNGLTISDATGGGVVSITTNAAALTLTANAASTWSTTAGALTITSAAAATWSTTAGNLTLQAGSGTVSLGSSTNLTAAAGLTVTAGAGSALTLTSPTAATWSTTAGALTITSAAAAAWGTASGKLTLYSAAAGTGSVKIGQSDTGASATPDLFVLDLKNTAGDPTGTAGAMYYNTTTDRFMCFEAGSWVMCGANAPSTTSLQNAYANGATITTTGGVAVTITTPIGSNNIGLVINQNNTSDNPIALQVNNAGNGVTLSLANAGTGNDITATNWAVTKAGNINTSGNINATGSGAITSAATLTASNGFTVTTGAVSVTGTSGALSLSNLGASSIVSTAGITITAGAASTWSTSAGALTLTSAAAATWGTAAGNLTLQVAGAGTSANIQIDGAAQTGTPDLFVLARGTAEPAGTAGAMYYNTSTAKFRCYENNAWKDCDTTGSGSMPAGTTNDSTIRYNLGTTAWVENTGVLASSAGTITIAAGQSYTGAGALTLSSGAASALTITANGNSTWSTSAGALTLTSAAAATWSTAAGNLTVDSAATLNLGTTNATAVSLSRVGITTTINGYVKISSTSTPITNHLSATASVDIGNISSRTCLNGTMTVTGARVGDTVIATPNGAGGVTANNLSWNAYVSALNTVTIRACNPTTGAIDPAAENFRADVWLH